MKHDHSGEISHSLEVPEGLKARIAQVKEHLQQNKQTYLIGAGCLVVGYLVRKPTVIEIVNEVKPTIAPVMNNIGNVVNNTVNNGSYARKIVRCIETDEMWPSMTKAAESAGHTLSAMSRHIHGHSDHLDGLHYVIEGLAA